VTGRRSAPCRPRAPIRRRSASSSGRTGLPAAAERAPRGGDRGELPEHPGTGDGDERGHQHRDRQPLDAGERAGTWSCTSTCDQRTHRSPFGGVFPCGRAQAPHHPSGRVPSHEGREACPSPRRASRTDRTDWPSRTGNSTAHPTAAKANDQRSLPDQSGHASVPTMQRTNTSQAPQVTDVCMAGMLCPTAAQLGDAVTLQVLERGRAAGHRQQESRLPVSDRSAEPSAARRRSAGR
jgi:hypothetical protein